MRILGLVHKTRGLKAGNLDNSNDMQDKRKTEIQIEENSKCVRHQAEAGELCSYIQKKLAFPKKKVDMAEKMVYQSSIKFCPGFLHHELQQVLQFHPHHCHGQRNLHL